MLASTACQAPGTAPNGTAPNGTTPNGTTPNGSSNPTKLALKSSSAISTSTSGTTLNLEFDQNIKGALSFKRADNAQTVTATVDDAVSSTLKLTLPPQDTMQKLVAWSPDTNPTLRDAKNNEVSTPWRIVQAQVDENTHAVFSWTSLPETIKKSLTTPKLSLDKTHNDTFEIDSNGTLRFKNTPDFEALEQKTTGLYVTIKATKGSTTLTLLTQIRITDIPGPQKPKLTWNNSGKVLTLTFEKDISSTYTGTDLLERMQFLDAESRTYDFPTVVTEITIDGKSLKITLPDQVIGRIRGLVISKDSIQDKANGEPNDTITLNFESLQGSLLPQTYPGQHPHSLAPDPEEPPILGAPAPDPAPDIDAFA